MAELWFRNRVPSFSTSHTTEVSIITSSLLVIEYIYVSSGLDLLINLMSLGMFFMLVFSYLLFEELHDEASVPRMIGYYAAIVVPGLGLLILTIIPNGIPDLLLLLLLVVGIALKTVDRPFPLRRAAVLFLLGYGLLVLVGAFPNTGSNLMGSPAGRPILIYPVLASENAVVFGFRTPVIMFDVSNPSFHARVHLVPLAVGAFSYVVARSEMALDSGIDG